MEGIFLISKGAEEIIPFWRVSCCLQSVRNTRPPVHTTQLEMAKKTPSPKATASQDAPPSKASANSTSKKASSSPSSSLLFIVVPLLVALIGGAWTTFGPQLADNAAVLSRALGSSDTNTTVAEVAFTDAVLKNKYESELVHIDTQKLLIPTTQLEAKCPTFSVQGDLTHVETAMGRADELKAEKRVFIMLNGQNEGVFVNWDAQDACLHELALFAAESLGTDVDILANGVKFMTQDGLALTSVAELDALRIAHVLFDFQIWVWPGIKVGHEFVAEGFKVKTASMRPKVFTVEGFFSQEEADAIIKQGIDRLTRSPVDSSEAVDGYHADRTSDTAFLHDNQFTRDFRVRTAKLTRLPSPSFVERMQLVRYQKGQFFRKHEDYFDSKQFIPKKEIASQEYETWTKWAAAKIQEIIAAKGEDAIPEAFRPGDAAFPNHEDKLAFQHSLLQAFLEDADPVDFFVEHADVEWGTWIRENVANRANDIVGPLMKDKGYMLPHMIKSWEKRVGVPELHYKMPKRPLSGVSQYFRWIRWAKERTQDLLDTNPSAIPADFRPEGPAYPTYHIRFQNRLARYVFNDYTKEELVAMFSAEWFEWFEKNLKSKDVLIEGLRTTTKIFELAVKSWTKRAGDAFAYT